MQVGAEPAIRNLSNQINRHNFPELKKLPIKADKEKRRTDNKDTSEHPSRLAVTITTVAC